MWIWINEYMYRWHLFRLRQCKWMFTNVHIFTNNVGIDVLICTRVCLQMYICECMMYICQCIDIYIYICCFEHVSSWVQTHICVCTQMNHFWHMDTDTCIHTHAGTCVRMNPMDSYVYVSVFICVYINIHTDTFTYVPWPIYMCDHASHDLFICETWLIHVRRTTRSHVFNYSSMHTYKCTHSYITLAYSPPPPPPPHTTRHLRGFPPRVRAEE